MASRSLAVCTLLLAGIAVPADANAFLKPHLGAEAGLMSRREVERVLLSELTLSSSTRIHAFEVELGPLFTAMPKNEHGNLEPSVTRYALHRYFVQKHGWHVNGLEPGSGAWNSSSPSSIMKDRVPAYIQGLIQERMHGQGMGLHELAAFAAVVSDLIRTEHVDNLQRVFSELRVSTSEPLSREAEEKVTASYVVAYFHDGLNDTAGNGTLNFKQMEFELEEEFLAWGDVSEWALDLRHTLQFTKRTRRNPFATDGTFHDVEEFAQELGHRFGAFQNMECHSLKDHLVDMEYRGTGRVRLSEFYSSANDTNWYFTESVEYLRALGALDESDPSKPSVIIPNFVGSRTNCVFPSSFYSVCCMDQCENLISSLERVIEFPDAAPARIASVISALPSETVEAPRNLSTPQLRRLGEIAALHGGRVPLHGRLFAQWMHHAYPRECPYPHASGTTNPLSPNEWEAERGSFEADEEEMRRHVATRGEAHDLAVAMTPEAKAEAMPWITVEELIVSRPPSSLGASTPLRSCLQVAGLVAFAASVLKAVLAADLASPRKESFEKHLV